MIFKKKFEEYKKQYENNLKLLEVTKKKSWRKTKKKKLFPQTYILHNDAGVVNPTFVSELQQYLNIFFSIYNI